MVASLILVCQNPCVQNQEFNMGKTQEQPPSSSPIVLNILCNLNCPHSPKPFEKNIYHQIFLSLNTSLGLELRFLSNIS